MGGLILCHRYNRSGRTRICLTLQGCSKGSEQETLRGVVTIW